MRRGIIAAFAVVVGMALAPGAASAAGPLDQCLIGELAAPAEPHLRLTAEAAEAGLTEPYVEEAYARELAQGLPPRARSLQGGRASGPVRIPVFVHVIQKSDTEGLVSDERIAQQMDVLNDSFAGDTGGDDIGMVFDLADTDRTINASWYSMGPGSSAESQAKSALHQGGTRALNLYVAGIGGGLLGWATFPGGNLTLDGVVVLNESLPGGSAAPYDLGDTAVHEVGHWLGLYHTFQGGCTSPGDLIDDTPYERDPAYGCPAGQDSCAAPGADPITNLMDYSDDACMYEFTPDQGDRMHEQMALYRNLAPSADPQSLGTVEAGSSTPLELTGADPEGDQISFSIQGPPAHGQLTGTGANMTYAADPGYEGPDSFTFRVTDVLGASDTATVAVEVEKPDFVVTLLSSAKPRQALGKLAVRAGCEGEACEVSAGGRIIAKPPGGGNARRARFTRSQADAALGQQAKLPLELSKPKRRAFAKLLNQGWKAKARAAVAATDAAANTDRARHAIRVLP